MTQRISLFHLQGMTWHRMFLDFYILIETCHYVETLYSLVYILAFVSRDLSIVCRVFVKDYHRRRLSISLCSFHVVYKWVLANVSMTFDKNWGKNKYVCCNRMSSTVLYGWLNVSINRTTKYITRIVVNVSRNFNKWVDFSYNAKYHDYLL